jgi:microsomal dipeptidase-like Zn-dependent dipeptidase
VLARYFDMDIESVRSVLSTQPFTLLKRKLKQLKASLKDPNSDREAVIVKDYAHLQKTLADPNKLALVMGVEGAHNLGFEYRGPDFPVPGKLYNFKNRVEAAEPLSTDLVDERIAWLKANHIRFLTLNHFVYNHLGSAPKAAELTGWKQLGHNPYKSHWQLGNYRGLTYLGYYLVERALKEGIILDLKHCDAITRHQIYKLAAQYNRPVVGSHIAFSGRPTNVSGVDLQVMEDFPADRKAAPMFNPWDINFHDDDILAIHRAGGLMGLIMDERVLSGGGMAKKILKREDYIWLLFNQIEHAYKVLTQAGIPAQEAFDSLCIGSDFDGFIEPLPNICTVEDYRYNPETDSPDSLKLDIALARALEEKAYIFRNSGLSPQDIVRKILRENTMRFLSQHFV